SAKGDDKFITTDYLQQCRTTTPHTPAMLLNTKKIPFNFSFAQTLVWAKPLFGVKKHGRT
ncbi:hypothetical protein N0T01_26690, partial [Klebsiella pneumoniae]|uniref:hypothetical protein n=1 Tax=Klebsiella pneumoniae TaxID=573 RepID=UPI0021804F18